MIALYPPPTLMTHYFLQTILIGFCLGLFYDILTGIGAACHLRRAAVYAIDAVFWVAILMTYFVFTVTAAGGQIRGFMLAGMGGGIVFFHMTLGWLIQKIMGWIVHGILRLGRMLTGIFRRIFCFVEGVCGRVQKKLKKIFKKTSIFGKKTL